MRTERPMANPRIARIVHVAEKALLVAIVAMFAVTFVGMDAAAQELAIDRNRTPLYYFLPGQINCILVPISFVWGLVRPLLLDEREGIQRSVFITFAIVGAILLVMIPGRISGLIWQHKLGPSSSVARPHVDSGSPSR